VHAHGILLTRIGDRLDTVEFRISSMRPKLASMPEESKIIAEAALDHRELDRVRRQKKFIANLVLGILSAGGGAALWEAWLRPWLHR
jgi:hypothetical protein